MKFIHAADLHLDVSLAGFPLEKQQVLRKERLDNLSRLCEYAVNNNIHVIVLAGDIYDSNTPQKTTVDTVNETIKNYSSIQFFVVPGNHDDKIWYDVPALPNLHIFTDSWKCFSLPYKGKNICFYGCVLRKDKSVEDTLPICDENSKNIVIMHGAFSSNSDRIKKSSLANKNIDYLALGHIHEYGSDLISPKEKGIWAYPGTLEAAGFDETGEKGFIVCDVDDEVNIEFVPFAKHRFYRKELSLSCITEEQFLPIFKKTKEDLLANIEDRANACVRIKLTGANFDLDPYRESFNEDTESLFFFQVSSDGNTRVTSEDTTHKEQSSKYRYEGDMEKLASQPSLLGLFAASVLKDKEVNDEERREIIAIGQQAIAGNEVLL